MKLLIAFLILVITASFSFSQALWSRAKLNTENGEKYGIILNNGTWLIEPNYDDIRVQYKYEDNGFVYFIVEQNDKLGLIDHTGKMILPVTFDVIIPYLHYLKVDVDGKEAAYSMSGKLIIDFTYQEISSLSDHKFLNISFYEPFIGFGNEDHFGVMDTSGNVIVPPKYDYVKNEGSFFEAIKGDKVNLFNQSGKLLNTDGFSEFFKSAHPLSEPDGYIMAKANGKWGVIDSLGTVVIEPVYSELRMHLNYIQIGKETLEGIALYSGEVFSKPDYEEIELADHQRSFKFKKDGKWGFYSFPSKTLVPATFDDVTFGWKYNRVMQNKMSGIWDLNGKYILEAKYNQINDLGDFYFHEANGSWGAVTKDGAVFLSPIYDSIWLETKMVIAQSNGKVDGFTKDGKKLIVAADETRCFYTIFFYKKNKRWGAINVDGDEVIPWLYSEIGEEFSNDLIQAKKNGKWGYISPKGEVVIPFMYDTAGSFDYKRAQVSKNGETFLIDLQNNRIKSANSNDPFTSGGTGYRPAGEGTNMSSLDDAAIYLRKNLLKAVWSPNHVGILRGEPQIVPTEFDEIVISTLEIINVKKDGLWGTFDFSGKQILEPKFTELTIFAKLTKTGDSTDEEECPRYTAESRVLSIASNPFELRYHSRHCAHLYEKQAERLSYYPRPTVKARFASNDEAAKVTIASQLVYPQKGRKLTEKTTVNVTCYVNEDGSLTFISFEDPTLPSYFLKEAKRVVEAINSWIPGRINGEKVRTKVTIPITFDPATYGTKTSK